MVLLKTEINRVTRKQVKRAKEDWVTVENTHEAIVSREVFQTVAKSFKRINRSFGKSINIFYCSGCGRKMNVCRGAILRCRINVAVTENNKCVETTISVKKAEQAILEDIKLKCQEHRGIMLLVDILVALYHRNGGTKTIPENPEYSGSL